jgi:hypothetical protein
MGSELPSKDQAFNAKEKLAFGLVCGGEILGISTLATLMHNGGVPESGLGRTAAMMAGFAALALVKMGIDIDKP